MTELKQLITDAMAMGLTEKSIIELMVLEGLPREACSEILRILNEYWLHRLINKTNFVKETKCLKPPPSPLTSPLL